MRSFGQRRGGLDGVLLRMISPEHIFEGSSKADARRVRDTLITDTTPFDSDGRHAIVIRFKGREIWQVRREGSWVDVCIMDVDADE